MRTHKLSVAPLAVGIPQAGGMIGLSRATVYKLIKAGRLRPIKIGARTLLPLSELKRFVTASAREASRDAKRSERPAP